MKKIGVISDVHGNLDGLRAILSALINEGCEEIIHTGDAVDIGPNSKECLELLLSMPNVTMLLGNHDRDFVLNCAEARPFSHTPTEHKRQVFDSMDDNLRRAAAKFPLYVTRDIGGSRVMFTHYAFKNEPFDMNKFPFHSLATCPTAEIFDKLFADADCDAVFFGHKHEPCEIEGRIAYIDVGSVGCHPRPCARGIVIEYDDKSWNYRRVHVPYDMEAVRVKMKKMFAGESLFDFYYLRLNVGDQD